MANDRNIQPERADAAREQAHAELKQAFNATVPMWVLGRDRRVLRVNDTFCEVFGVHWRDALDRPCGEVLRHGDPPVERVMAGEDRVDYETRVDTAVGESLWFFVTATPYRDPRGQCVGVVESFTDITERKRAEDLLESAHTELNQVFNATVPMWVVGCDRRVLRVNDTFCAAFGVHWRDVLGKRCDEIWPEGDATAAVAALERVAKGAERFEYEIEARTDRGAAMHCAVTATPYRDPRGNLLGVIENFADITRRKQAEEALSRLNAELEDRVRERTRELEVQTRRAEEADRMKTEFLANMSHELRTPLNSIIGLSELMIGRGVGKKPEQEAKYLDVIHRNGAKLLKLIGGILDLAKVEAGRMDVEAAAFDPARVAEQAVDEVRLSAEAKGLRLEARVEAAPRMFSDEAKLQQILVNFLSNAVKFTEKGRIVLRVEAPEADRVVFRVRDTGVGIEPDRLRTIFDSFRQADGSTTRAYEGAGLGLAISRKLAQLLGGSIWAESAPGEGSEFALVLPRRVPPEAGTRAGARDAARDAASASGPSAPTLAGKTALVVQDNPDSLFTIEEILDGLECGCIAAGDGRQAVEAARRYKPDLILMGMHLPVMDGLDATRAIKAEPGLRPIPVVALTGRAMKGDRERILAAGCDDYLPKPFNPADLERVVRKWLGEGIG